MYEQAVDLVMMALPKAYTIQKHPKTLMSHSVQESQYTDFAFRQLLDSLNVVLSFLKKTIPLPMPTTNASLNILIKEEFNHKTYHSPQEL